MIDRDLAGRILRLARVEGWPVNTIASQLGVHHDVVERVLREAGTPRPVVLRSSRIDRYVAFLQETWRTYPRLPASRLYRMCQERGYVGSPDHFRHMAARYRPPRPVEAFLRLRTLPGEQAQVDWAHFGHLEIGRATRPLVAFLMVLSFSRAIFLRFCLAMRTEDFLRAHQEAFARWGGVVRVCLYDNLKSVVLERMRDAIHFNSLLLAFAAHYTYDPRPVAPRRGNEKGRVERAVSFVRTGFFLARSWRDLADLNAQADAWCLGPALDRPWPEDPGRTVRQAFEEESARFLALPPNPFPVEERVEVSVGKTPYVRFDRNDYSVPPAFVRRTLTVLATPTEVRILSGNEEVARHRRSYDARQQIEDPAHLAALVEQKRHAHRHRGLDRLTRAVPACGTLIDLLALRGANLGLSTARMLELLDAYGADALERAVREVVERDVPHVHAVRQVLERNRAAQGRPPALSIPLPDDPRVRDLVVRPHSLEGYDTLATPPPTEEGEPDDPQTPAPVPR